MPHLLRRAWNYFHYRFIHAPRGGGKPVPVATLDEEYRSGHWDHFQSETERPRYEALLGLINAHAAGPALLDVGCGSGELAARLDPVRYRGYLGVDISAEGLARARARHLPHARFESGNFETWRPAASFDVIVFNEVVGYAKHPAAVVTALARHLQKRGVLVISLYRWGNYRQIWRRIGQTLSVVEARVVTNERRQVWDLKVLAPHRPAAPEAAS